LKEKDDLEKFIARFSANASKAKQATSRQKQLDKLRLVRLRLLHEETLLSYLSQIVR